MENENKGSGVAFTDILAALTERRCKEYRESLQTFVNMKRLTKKGADDLAAGFRDGMGTMARDLKGMGAIVIKEGP